MSTRTRVLITNDDGVHAPGIRRLAGAAHAHGFDVVVAAPLEEASGMSAALTAATDDGRVVLSPQSLPGLPGVPVFGVAASPAYLAVLAAIGAFGPPPALVLSGINRGANAGRAVLHSGTVGAALTAATHGVSAMAVSLDVLTLRPGSPASAGAALAVADRADDEARHWDTAAELAAGLFDWLRDAPAGTVLNLNVPDRPAGTVAGLREAELARFGQVQMAVSESGEDFLRIAIVAATGPPAAGTDIAWLARGWATVTALRPPAAAGPVTIPTQRRASRRG
jgi:5'-nucleotidase